MISYDKRLRIKRLTKLREVIKRINETAANEKKLVNENEIWLDAICEKYGMMIKK